MTTQADVAALRGKLTAIAALFDGSTPDRATALRLITEALGVLERLLAGKHSIQNAALFVAVRITGIDIDGRLVQWSDGLSPGEHLRKTAAALEAFAGAVVEASVQASVLAAPRVHACGSCTHLQEERAGFLHEIEGLRLELAALKAQLKEHAGS